MANMTLSKEGLVIAGRRIPATRGQLMLGLVAMNEFILSLDIWLAHDANGTIRPFEWIPIIFGVVAGVLLLLAGLISLRRRGTAIVISLVVFLSSIVVGLLGAFFHLQRAIPPSGVLGSGKPLDLFVFAPPVLGPLAFAGIAIIGVIAAVYERPADSGNMVIPGLFSWQVPLNKTRQYLVWVGLGILVSLLNSVLDHGRFNFENVYVWIPTVVGVFATVSAITLGFIEEPSEGEINTFIVTMIVLIVVGAIGFFLHVGTDLTAGGGIVWERFLRGAPLLAPLLFSNMGMFGLLAVYPVEEAAE